MDEIVQDASETTHPQQAKFEQLEQFLDELGVSKRYNAEIRSNVESLAKYFGPVEKLMEQLGFEEKLGKLRQDCLECELVQPNVVGGQPGNIFTATDGTEYPVPFPGYREFLDAVKGMPPEQLALLGAKLKLLGADQQTGFQPDLHVELTGANFGSIIEALDKQTRKYGKQGKLFSLGDPEVEQNGLLREGVTLKDAYCWDGWKNPRGHLLQTPSGLQSQEAVVANDPSRAHRIVILDGALTIPHQPEGDSAPVVTGTSGSDNDALTRHQRTGGSSVNDTEALLRSNPAYALEQCESLFGSASLATLEMHRTQGGVLADYNSMEDCARRAGGSRSSSGRVGSFFWSRDVGRFYAGGDFPGYGDSGGAVPSVVRVS